MFSHSILESMLAGGTSDREAIKILFKIKKLQMDLYFYLQLEVKGRIFLYIRCISESCKYLQLRDQIK